MWSNKPSARLGKTGPYPVPERTVDIQALDPEGTRSDGRGVAGGLRIVGEIRGREDLYIAGEVNGSVYLPDCVIQVGPHARVRASMTARVVEIEGIVNGDVAASERIVIRSSGQVTGDVASPQIQIDEGCKFKGSVQMQEPDLESGTRDKSRLAADAVRYQAANE